MTVAELEKAVTKLSRPEFDQFTDWLEEFADERWDRELTEDIQNGLLNSLADEALADFSAGRIKLF